MIILRLGELMKKLKDKYIKYLYLIPILTILTVIGVLAIIKNNGIIVFSGDSYEQILQIYMGMWEKFHNGTFGFWNWNIAFGANSFDTVYYGFLNNPYIYLTLLFPKSLLPQVFSFINLLKLFLVYLFAYWWLLKLKRSVYASIIGALIITFSGWVMCVYNWSIFLDSYPFYFLTLYSIEKFYDTKKIYPMILSLSLTIIINFYSGYMFLPFILIYCSYRYYNLNVHTSLVGFFKNLGRFIGYILIAVCISGFILLPSAYIILQSSRLENIFSFDFLNFDTLYRFLTSLLFPAIYRLNPNILIDLNSVNGIGWAGGTSLYSLIVSLIFLPLLPFLKNKKERNSLLLIYFLFIVILLFPTLYILMQGSQETRWFYMFSIISAIAVSLLIDELLADRILRKYSLFSFIGVSVLIAVCIFISYKRGYLFIINNLFLLVKCYFVFSIFYLIAIYRKSGLFILIITTCEALLCFGFLLNYDFPIQSSLVNSAKYSSLIDYLDTYDTDQTYRIYLSKRVRDVANTPIAYDFKSTSVYSSLYNFQQEDYLVRYKGSWLINQSDGRVFNYTLENIKYWIGYSNEVAPFGFNYITSYDNYLIYENKYYLGLGHMSDNLISDEVANGLSFIEQDQLMLNYTFTENAGKDYLLNNDVIEIAEWVNPRYFEYKTTNSANGTMIFVENFAMENVTIQFYLQDQLVLSEYHVQYNYVGTYCPADISFDKVVVFIDDIYNYDSFMNVYMMQDFKTFDEAYQINNQNTLQNVVIDNDFVSADITVDDELADGVLVTSIAYDEGWKAYVDGVEMPIIKVDLGFVGLKLTPGYHEIEFHYTSPYFKIGCLISIVGVVMLIILVREEKKQYKKNDKISMK